jgi:SAM-dependent methyltransferase
MSETRLSPAATASAADYDAVAAEYYDPQRHPTCANFGELSARFIGERILKLASAAARVLEVGAGRSIVAPVLAKVGRPLKPLTLVDSSAAMLANSAEWKSQGATTLVADVCATSLPSDSYDVIVASLCDPYNGPAFWREMSRLLAPGGRGLATLPAVEWVMRFRDAEERDQAEFVLASGRRVSMPSFVPALERQLSMIAEAGLTVAEHATYSLADLTGPPSPKLEVFTNVPRGPVLRGFTVAKI